MSSTIYGFVLSKEIVVVNSATIAPRWLVSFSVQELQLHLSLSAWLLTATGAPKERGEGGELCERAKVQSRISL